jgi:hypothetical protein
MDSDDLKELIVTLAAVADRLDQRSESAVQRVERTGATLHQSADRLGSNTQAFARDVLQAIEKHSGEAIARGTGQAVEQCNAQLRNAAQTATASARELDQMRDAMRRERRTWVWLVSGALIVGSMLSVGAAGYAVTTSKRQVERNRIEADLLRAYNAADVTLCGGKLCANVDISGARSGDQKQYRPVKPR